VALAQISATPQGDAIALAADNVLRTVGTAVAGATERECRLWINRYSTANEMISDPSVGSDVRKCMPRLVDIPDLAHDDICSCLAGNLDRCATHPEIRNADEAAAELRDKLRRVLPAL